MEELSFKNLYNKVANLNRNLYSIDAQYLDEYTSRIDKYKLDKETNKYITICLLATILVICTPSIYINGYAYSENALKAIKAYFSSPKTKPQTLIYTLYAISFALFIYFIIMPVAKLINKSLNKNSPSDFIKLDPKHRNYVLALFISIYAGLATIVMTIYINDIKIAGIDSPTVELVAILILVIPISLAIYFILLSIISYSIILTRKRTRLKYSDDYRLEISQELMISILELNDSNNYILSNDNKIYLRLNRISYLIRHYPLCISEYLRSTKLFNEYEKTSRAFDGIIVNLINLEEDTINDSIKELVNYLNIFLSGNVGLLPKSSSNTSLIKAKGNKIQIKSYLYICLALTSPIIIISIIQLFTQINNVLLSFLNLLYIIWALIVILSSPTILSSDNKEFVRDIFKILIGRRE